MMARMHVAHVAAMPAPASPRPSLRLAGPAGVSVGLSVGASAGSSVGASAGSSGLVTCPDGYPPQGNLTRRERDILPYLVSGKSNKYISIELSISSRTAEAHRANILRKMGVRSTMELACRVCPHRRAGE